MPQCRKCGRPIFFLAERPEYIITGSYTNPKQVRTEPRPVPIDIDPDPIRGTLAIYEQPNRHSAYPPDRDFTGTRQNFIRLMTPEVAAFWRRAGGELYRIHFDTCPAGR
jgi:hypothetical protein